MSTVTPLIKIQDLEVNYGSQVAVGGVSLELLAGQRLALLGINGAGKTSTIRALTGMVRPSRGSVNILGQVPGSAESFRQLGFAPEEADPPEFMSGKEFLTLVGEFRISKPTDRKAQVAELLNWFELDPQKRIRQYSKGMRRRLILAQALIGNPKLVILDEPLSGLDPLFIMKLRERLTMYWEGGGTLLFSSHILAEAEKVCTQVAMIHQGKLVTLEEAGSLVGQYGSIEAAFSKVVRGQ